MGPLAIELSGIPLKNPLIAASGCAGYGHDLPDLCSINDFGGIALKGTTKESRFGNPGPRIAEAPSGLINSVGLQNPGIDAVLNSELPALTGCYNGVIIANISGFSPEEYEYLACRVDADTNVDIIEVNISCPNVHNGGMAFGTTPEGAAEITRLVRSECTKPLYVKLSPNVTDITEIAKACEAAGADGISLINTLLAMRIDLTSRRPVLANTFGGLSGPAVFPVALRMIWQVYEAVDIPLIGLGGISSAKDVIEMLLAGASAVQIGAAFLKDPLIHHKILAKLPACMDELGINTLQEIIGGAH